MKILLKNRELSAFLAILALFAVLVALNPSYLSLQTLGMIFASSQILILLAIGAALVMLTRNIDVSVGSTVGLSAIAVGVALNSGYSLPVSILFALSIGALAGAFNGFLVVGLRIPAIVATLGTLGLYRGAMLLWTGGKWIEGLPPGLKSLSEPAAVGISPLGMLVLIIAATGAWTLSRTAFGRDFYAVGDNLTAARQLGVAVNRTRMIAFTLNGLLAACVGIVFAAQIGFVPNQTGSGLEMKAIAACVLGGHLAAGRHRHAGRCVPRRVLPHPNRYRAGAVQAPGVVERLYRRAGAAGRAGARRASASGTGAASAGAEIQPFPAR